MPTSGTAEFNLDLNNLIEEAFERCGAELRTGYNWRTARRSLNLMSIEWANRGINLWTVEQGSFLMTTGQAIYPIPSDTIDLLDHVIRTQPTTLEQIDINISRIAEPTYSSIPNKLAQGRPIQVWFNRQTGAEYTTAVTLAQNIDSVATTIPLSTTVGLPAAGFIKLDNETISYPNISGNSLVNCARGQNNTTAASHNSSPANYVTVQNLPCINVWPTPNAPGDQYTFVYWRMRRIQDGGLNGTVVQDIPFRLLPCMVAGLAFYLSMKLPEVDPSRVAMLKAAYEEQWDLASAEDRDTAPLRIVPRNMFYYG
jgi:hypothetical protein